MRVYRSFGASLAWITLVTQYWLNVRDLGLNEGSMTFFGFFTILSNIFVACALTAPLLANPGPLGLFLRAGVRTAVGVYIFVTGTIFFFLLRNLYVPAGLGWYLNIVLHYIMPVFYLLDWLFFTPKRSLSYRSVPFWLIFPLVYSFWAFGRGVLTGFYTYPFLDAGKYGVGQVAINVLCLTIMFIFLSIIFVTLGRALPATRNADLMTTERQANI